MLHNRLQQRASELQDKNNVSEFKIVMIFSQSKDGPGEDAVTMSRLNINKFLNHTNKINTHIDSKDTSYKLHFIRSTFAVANYSR